MTSECRTVALAAGVWIAASLAVRAHAVRHAVLEGATVIQWHYDDGQPLARREVVVLAPGEDKEVYQGGMTDRSGVFAFLPNTNGRWTVTVDDGMGHRADVYVDVDPYSAPRVSPGAEPDRLGGLVVGAGVIFGCFGLYTLFADRWKRCRRDA